MASEKSSPLPSRINDRYRVVRLLGRGGMGEVYLVEDSHRGFQRLALKTLRPETTDRLLTAGFRDEFGQLAKLRHRNLATAYDFGRVQGTRQHFFTTEYVEGVDLLQATEDATVEQILGTAVQLLEALDFIHRHGILHNDLKPANVLLEHDPGAGKRKDTRGDLQRLEALAYGRLGRLKLIDFGLISSEHTAWNQVLGTLRYISPERILREEADRRSDLYSLGVLLYVLFARRPPFLPQAPRLILKCHLREPPPPLANFRADVPEAAAVLVHRLLEKKPENRFQSAASVLEFLEKELEWGDEARGPVPAVGSRAGTRHSSRLQPGSLLARDRELQTLLGHYEAIRSTDAAPSCVVVEGPAGTGKTRLVEELRGHVQLSGGVFVHVAGPAVEGNLQPLIDAFGGALKTSGVAGLDALLGRVRSMEADETGHLGSTLENLVLWFAESSPILFFLDDADNSSPAVQSFVRELTHTVATARRTEGVAHHILVVIARRSAERTAALRLPEAPVIELGRLSVEESIAFLENTFHEPRFPEAIGLRLARLSEGNPLFLIELSNALVARGKVRRSGAHWTFPETLEGIELPESLAEVLDEKLASLSRRGIDLLTAFAVAEHVLPRSVLERSSHLAPEELDQVLDDLLEQNVLTVRKTEGEREYRLTSSSSRPQLLERLEPGERARLHQRIAQSIEEAIPDWEEKSDLIAQHWLEAGNEAAFLRFAPRAAELLRQRGDLERAVEYHRRLAEVIPDTAVAKKIQSLARLSEMDEFLWDLEDCRSDIERILELGERLLTRSDRALLLRRLGCVEMSRFRWEEAERFLTQAEELTGEDDPFGSVSVRAARSLVYWHCGRKDSATRALEDVERTLREQSPSNPRDQLLVVGASNHVATLYQQLGNLSRATDLLSRNLEVLQASTGGNQALAATRCALGSVLLERGLYPESEGYLTEALRSSKEIADARTLCRTRERLGELYLRFGRFKEALRVTEVGLEDAEGIRNLGAVATALRTLGKIYLYADQTDDALRSFRRAAALHREAGDTLNEALSRLHLARIHVEEGRLEEGDALVKAASEGASSVPLVAAWCDLLRSSLTWRSRGSLERSLLDKAEQTVQRCGYHGEAIDLLLSRFEIEFEAEQFDDARATVSRLEERARGQGMPSLSCELTYLHGLLRLDTVGRKEREAFLKKAGAAARNRKKLRIARRCEALLERRRTPVT